MDDQVRWPTQQPPSYVHKFVRAVRKGYSHHTLDTGSGKDQFLPGKHKTFLKHLYNAGPTSKTLGRRCTNVIKMFCVCWVGTLARS